MNQGGVYTVLSDKCVLSHKDCWKGGKGKKKKKGGKGSGRD